jgi:hypothetical protein
VAKTKARLESRANLEIEVLRLKAKLIPRSLRTFLISFGFQAATPLSDPVLGSTCERMDITLLPPPQRGPSPVCKENEHTLKNLSLPYEFSWRRLMFG